MTNAKHSVSVAGVIADGTGSALVIRRRDNGHWELPGGILELNETIYEGLRREIFEETELVIKPGPLTGIYKNMSLGVVALVFQCSVVSGSPCPTEEVSEVAWMSPEQIRMNMVDAFAVRLLDGLKAGAIVAIRNHDGEKLL